MFDIPDYFYTRIEWTFIFVLACHLLGEYVMTPQWMEVYFKRDVLIQLDRSLIYILPYVFLMGMNWKIPILLGAKIGTVFAQSRQRRIDYKTARVVCFITGLLLYICPVIWFYYIHWDVMKGASI